MDQFVVAKKVISVNFGNKIYEKKDKKIFTEKDFKIETLLGAYKDGFLDKKVGDKTFTYQEEISKKVEKKVPVLPKKEHVKKGE